MNDLDLYRDGTACPIWMPYYTISLATGDVDVHGTPPQYAFEAVWTQMAHLPSVLPKILGNLLAHAETRWGEMYTEELMAQSGRKYFTLAQYKSTYSRLPVENQRPGVNHTTCRIVAQLDDPEQQAAILDRVESGEFDEPDEEDPTLDKEQRIRAAVHQVKGERPPAPPSQEICPICGARGWFRQVLHKVECTECGAHGEELLDRLAFFVRSVQSQEGQ